MPPFRNPFVKKPPTVNGLPFPHDENVSSSTPNGVENTSPRADYASSRASSTLSIKKKEEPSEYKLSGTLPVRLDGVFAQSRIGFENGPS